MERTLKKDYIVLLECICFVYGLFSEVVSYTIYSIERYIY